MNRAMPSVPPFSLSFSFVFCSLFLFSNGVWGDEREKDRIINLPGQPKVSFEQFSGYVTVNQTHGRALFYWLTEATSNANEKPLVLWLNGGPGCSSIAFGASEEIGPFRVNKTGHSLYLNKFSWNKDANLLFLESPAGVGFSYTNTTSDLKDSGDERTAQDALVFLIKWLARFPEYRYREFYICGESYAGHYIPQLAKKIEEYNKITTKPYLINLKGILVGNGVMDNYYDNLGTVNYWWSHALISDTTYEAVLSSCNFSEPEYSANCNGLFDYISNHEFGKIDQYSIYTPPCSSNATALWFKNTLLRRRIAGYDPCTENYAERFYNSPDVQRALHANTTRIPYKWTGCSDLLNKNWQDSDFSMLPTYRELIKAGLRIWVFSGDVDAVVPVTATRFSLSHLNLPVKIPWYPWYSKGQVGGRSEVYHGLTFATVRGAGHEVPVLQPTRALTLFRSFLAGKPLPTS
ncbi:hypothetical protein AMTRI_Chr12g239790 [Amborella trichopoda]